jgi:hypothetical protein
MEQLADNVGAIAGWWLPIIITIGAVKVLAPHISRAWTRWLYRSHERRLR